MGLTILSNEKDFGVLIVCIGDHNTKTPSISPYGAALGSSCSTAVEWTPHNRDAAGLIPAEGWAFVLKQVPRGAAELLLFLYKNECLAVQLGEKQAQ